jgi:hypothetical protein
MAKQMAPEKFLDPLKKHLDMQDAKVQVYASLLGDCGKKSHALVVQEILAERIKEKKSVDAVLVGLTLLDNEKGIGHIHGLFERADTDFIVRYGALTALRFLRKERPDAVSEKQVVDGLGLLMKHEDCADFAIEDLRKLQRWDKTGVVLALYREKLPPYLKRAILRFAIQSPDPMARTLIEREQQRDPDAIREMKELLDLEKLLD